eukprot:gene57761-79147_t
MFGLSAGPRLDRDVLQAERTIRINALAQHLAARLETQMVDVNADVPTLRQRLDIGLDAAKPRSSLLIDWVTHHAAQLNDKDRTTLEIQGPATLRDAGGLRIDPAYIDAARKPAVSPRLQLKRLGRFLMRPGVLLSIAALLVGLLIWFLGQLIVVGGFQPLGSIAVRLACLLVLALAWGIGSLLLRNRRTSEEDALLAALRQQQREADDAHARDADSLDAEFAGFRESIRAAMQFLRQGRRNWLVSPRYALP